MMEKREGQKKRKKGEREGKKEEREGEEKEVSLEGTERVMRVRALAVRKTEGATAEMLLEAVRVLSLSGTPKSEVYTEIISHFTITKGILFTFFIFLFFLFSFSLVYSLSLTSFLFFLAIHLLRFFPSFLRYSFLIYFE